jgi:hypothetical protein
MCSNNIVMLVCFPCPRHRPGVYHLRAVGGRLDSTGLTHRQVRVVLLCAQAQAQAERGGEGFTFVSPRKFARRRASCPSPPCSLPPPPSSLLPPPSSPVSVGPSRATSLVKAAGSCDVSLPALTSYVSTLLANARRFSSRASPTLTEADARAYAEGIMERLSPGDKYLEHCGTTGVGAGRGDGSGEGTTSVVSVQADRVVFGA